MPKYTFELNGEKVSVDAPADLSVLWTLRDKLGVTGPKYGCGINVCKACTSHVDDAQPFNPCVTDLSQIDGRKITTIEGLAKDGKLTPVQRAWLEQDVAQCGYCQPGQIMVATALLKTTRTPTDADIDTIDNVCRCGTYFRIREAVKAAVRIMDAEGVDAMGNKLKGKNDGLRPLAPVPSGSPSTASGATTGAAPVATGVSTGSLPTTGVSSSLAAGAAVLVGGGAMAAKTAQTASEPA